MKKPVYVFRCPVCRHVFRSDQPGEPGCTGPSETTDDHPMAVMQLQKIERREVGPRYAQRRAQGTLLIPDTLSDDLIEREAKIALAKQ